MCAIAVNHGKLKQVQYALVGKGNALFVTVIGFAGGPYLGISGTHKGIGHQTACIFDLREITFQGPGQRGRPFRAFTGKIAILINQYHPINTVGIRIKFVIT